MPQKKAAAKALRQTKIRTEKNKKEKAELNKLIRAFKKLVEQGNEAESRKNWLILQKKLDKAAKKNLINKNTINRMKSSFSKMLNRKFAKK